MVTFDMGLNEACGRVGGRTGVRHVITKFSRIDSLPNFVTHGAPLRARESSAKNIARRQLDGQHLLFGVYLQT